MTENQPPAGGISRRQLIKGAGVGAAALVLGPSAAQAAPGMIGAAAASAAGAPGSAALLQLARVWGAPGVDLSSFDDSHVVFDDGSIELVLWPGDRQRLDATGLRYEVTVEDLAAHDAALAAAAPPRPSLGVLKPQPGERSDYRRLPDFETDIRDLVARFPDKARMFTLPEQSLEGRPVVGIEIANDVAHADGRPVFYQDGVHHAREWPAAEMPIMWAFDLLENNGKDERITALMAGARHVIIPVVNPDGFHHSRESLVQNSNMGTLPPGGLEGYWRKNRRSFTGATVPVAQKNPDAYGIDNNRNYGYKWGGPGSSESDFNQDSRGDAPLSEPETRNVVWAFNRWPFTAANTNHTAGNLILRAWGDTFDNPPDDKLLKQLGDAMGVITGYKSQKSIQLYITTGTCSDFMYGAYGSLGYTFEHSGSGFHPAYAGTVPAMYAKVRKAFLLLAEAAMNPSYHSIIRGRVVDEAGAPTAGTVQVKKTYRLPQYVGNPAGLSDIANTIAQVPVDTGPDGTFELHTNPSTMPFLAFEGKTEAYDIVATAGARGGRAAAIVARGETLDLGDIVVG